MSETLTAELAKEHCALWKAEAEAARKLRNRKPPLTPGQVAEWQDDIAAYDKARAATDAAMKE